MIWHGTQNELEYDFVVRPGADPSKIRFALKGAQNLHIDQGGNLVAKTSAGEFAQKAPTIYQETAEGRRMERREEAVENKGRRPRH